MNHVLQPVLERERQLGDRPVAGGACHRESSGALGDRRVLGDRRSEALRDVRPRNDPLGLLRQRRSGEAKGRGAKQGAQQRVLVHEKSLLHETTLREGACTLNEYILYEVLGDSTRIGQRNSCFPDG